MDFNTYVITLITVFVTIFPAMIFTFIANKRTISTKVKHRTIFASIIIYAIIVLILTILYKNISFVDFENTYYDVYNFFVDCYHYVSNILKNTFNSFVVCKDYIHDNILEHWYNFFLLWINVDVTMSIFDSKLLTCIWAIPILLIIVAFIFILCIIIDEEFEAIDLIFFIPVFAIILLLPMTWFYIINSFYIACNYSAITTVITLLCNVLFLIFLCIVIKKKHTISNVSVETNNKT